MNKTNEYNYVPNQVNIRIRIRIRDIRFASYPTTSGSVSIFELEYSKKCYPDPISCIRFGGALRGASAQDGGAEAPGPWPCASGDAHARCE